MSAKAMGTAMNHLKKFFKDGSVQRKGTVIIGTVEGDLHDIGKNLVAMMVEGNGYEVIDLGVDVKAEKFEETLEQHPGAFVVVTGCYAQLKPEQVSNIEGVDLVLGAEQKGELINYLGSLEKHEHGEAITTATKDIRSFAPSCSLWGM